MNHNDKTKWKWYDIVIKIGSANGKQTPVYNVCVESKQWQRERERKGIMEQSTVKVIRKRWNELTRQRLPLITQRPGGSVERLHNYNPLRRRLHYLYRLYYLARIE